MKHAFLIMAHNEPYILKILVSHLSSCGDDVYVHVDKKVKGDMYKQLVTAIEGGVNYVQRESMYAGVIIH